jgi:type III pantothenate kinase
MILPVGKNGGPEADGGDVEQTRPPIVVVDIGNSSTAAALWSDGKVFERRDFRHDQREALQQAVKALADETAGVMPSAVVIASVVPDALNELVEWIRGAMGLEPMVVGRQIPLPMPVKLPNPEAVGVDRICTAAAAHHVKQEPCVVVDFGSAVTVDVVDSEGAFIGGAIAPGLHMQARSLHEHTAALPDVEPNRPDDTIGQDTADAIRGGIHYGTAGAVRHIVETFATHIGRWPPVVATGGDAPEIAEECGIFDNVVPDLCLMGIGLAHKKWLDEAVIL